MPIYLNQSLIKELTSYGFCPRKTKAYLIDNDLQSEPSEYMFRGIYFEYMAMGNLPKSGEVPVYPKLKSGKYEIHKERIDEQVQAFYSILEKEGIEFLAGAQTVEYRYSDVVTFFINIDSLVIYRNKLCVMDTKLTLDVNSTFGKLAWGNYSEMDKFQAYFYSYVLTKVLGEEVGFLYAVFDYKKSKREYRIFYEEMTDAKMDIMFERIQHAENRYRWADAQGWKPRANEETCKKCAISDCPLRFQIKESPVEKEEVIREGKLKAEVEMLLEMMME